LLKEGATIAGDLATTGANIYKIIMETNTQPKVESYMEQVVDYNPNLYYDMIDEMPVVEIMAPCPKGVWC